jgi:3-phosphoinositide dependent protein kinase-1
MSEGATARDDGLPERTSGVGQSFRAPRVTLTLRDFDVLGRIGDGSFSTVFLARRKETDKDYAIKMMNKHLIMRNKMVDYIKNERAILDKLDDAGIAKLHFTFQDPENLCECHRRP